MKLNPIIGIFAILLVGCVSVGSEFVRVPNDALLLGHTTYQQLVDRFGPLEKKKKSIKVKNGVEFIVESGTYGYAAVNLLSKKSLESLVYQEQSFDFIDDKVVGYNYSSSRKEDSTDIDLAKAAKIKKGESTYSDIVRLLGPPHGKSIYPYTTNTNEEVLHYNHLRIKRTTEVNANGLKVELNQQGVVTNIEFIEIDASKGMKGFSRAVGMDFARVPDDALVLGQTTYEQIVVRFGPLGDSRYRRNGIAVKSGTYEYIGNHGEAAAGVIPERKQVFHFVDNKLVSYRFTSSWEKDSTDFDRRKVLLIKKDESTRNDVIRLLGPPGGKKIYPFVPNKDEEVMVYSYSQYSQEKQNKAKSYTKELEVTIHKQGIVTNVDYNETGEK
jgi:hypothetical protein